MSTVLNAVTNTILHSARLQPTIYKHLLGEAVEQKKNQRGCSRVLPTLETLNNSLFTVQCIAASVLSNRYWFTNQFPLEHHTIPRDLNLRIVICNISRVTRV